MVLALGDRGVVVLAWLMGWGVWGGGRGGVVGGVGGLFLWGMVVSWRFVCVGGEDGCGDKCVKAPWRMGGWVQSPFVSRPGREGPNKIIHFPYFRTLSLWVSESASMGPKLTVCSLRRNEISNAAGSVVDSKSDKMCWR